MTPKSPTPGTDWLASVAAQNRERDDELERLRAENKALYAELLDLKDRHRATWNKSDQRRIRVALLEQERDALKARVAELERALQAAADYVDPDTSMPAIHIVRAAVATIPASPVPSAWPPTPMPIYDFRATSEDGAGE